MKYSKISSQYRVQFNIKYVFTQNYFLNKCEKENHTILQNQDASPLNKSENPASILDHLPRNNSTLIPKCIDILPRQPHCKSNSDGSPAMLANKIYFTSCDPHHDVYLKIYFLYSDKLSTIWHLFWHSILHSIWHTFWQSIWHSIWHILWHSVWHSICHILWHSIWHIFWHSVWHSIWHIDILSDIYSGILSDIYIKIYIYMIYV